MSYHTPFPSFPTMSEHLGFDLIGPKVDVSSPKVRSVTKTIAGLIWLATPSKYDQKGPILMVFQICPTGMQLVELWLVTIFINKNAELFEQVLSPSFFLCARYFTKKSRNHQSHLQYT